MKPFKIIIISTLVVLLVLAFISSITLNIVLWSNNTDDATEISSVDSTIDSPAPEDFQSQEDSEVSLIEQEPETDDKSTGTDLTINDTTVVIILGDVSNSINSSVVDNEASEPEEPTEELIYQDDNIKVKYLYSEDGPSGPVHKFEIENTTTKPLTVLFTDLYINGHPVYSSGLTCEKLQPDTAVVEEMFLLMKEYTQFTDYEVTFTIKLINAKSCLDLYESEQITLKFQMQS